MPFDAMNFQDDQRQRDLDVLRAARAEIVKPGMWSRGGYRKPDGSRCAVGWVVWALDTSSRAPISPSGYATAADFLFDQLPSRWRDMDDSVAAVTGYNDHPFRRQSTIVRLFDRAIAAREKALLNA